MERARIYDIGANTGEDTAFYLAKGFDVVAVEADPALVDALNTRFAAEIAAGRLAVEGSAICDMTGEATFFVNDFNEWSSLVEDGQATRHFTHRRITVPTLSLPDLLARYGPARYVKMDIEGSEGPALAQLTRDDPLPRYLSVEVHKDWREVLQMLRDLGYEAFQMIRQGKGHLADAPVPAREGRDVAQTFVNAQSGVFGRDLEPGAWMDGPGLLAHVVAETRLAQDRLARGEKRGWHDIHCRLG